MDLARAGTRDIGQLLTEAAAALTVAYTDGLTFSNVLPLVREIADPEIRFEVGDRPEQPGVVYVATTGEHSALFGARTRSGRSLYVRITCDPGVAPPLWEYARDDAGRDAWAQTEWHEGWTKTRRSKP